MKRKATKADTQQTDPPAKEQKTEPSFWLMKSEPESRIVDGKDVKFSIDDLKEMGRSPWDGVRNYEARNIMRDKMKLGDTVLFYHSNTKVPGIAGLARVSRECHVDHTAFDKTHAYYDPKSSKDSPKWYMVEVEFIEKFKELITLEEMKGHKNGVLGNMVLLNRGRLSVQPVSKDEFDFIMTLRKESKENKIME